MADPFQTSFMNGLTMAQAVEGQRLQSMQQAATMQYQMGAKQIDFQMDLLKMQDMQAQRVVEARQSEIEFGLRQKEYALRLKTAERQAQTMALQMEDQNVASAAGAVYQTIATGASANGIPPGTPEAFMFAEKVLSDPTAFAKTDPKVMAKVRGALQVERKAFVDGAVNQAFEMVKSINASDQAVTETETGTTTTKMFGMQEKAEFMRVADLLEPAAKLGDPRAISLRNDALRNIQAIGAAPQTGVKEAAKTAEQSRLDAAGIGGAVDAPFNLGGSMESFRARQSQTAASQFDSNVTRAATNVQTRLARIAQQYAGDPVRAERIKMLADRADAAISATRTGMPARNSMDYATWEASSLNAAELERLSGIQDDTTLVNELSSVLSRRVRDAGYTGLGEFRSGGYGSGGF